MEVSNHMVQIFIAHSSKDKWIIDPICESLKSVGVVPYLAELDTPTALPLPEKLDREIRKSVALLAILTPNVMNARETWDTVNWEIATARAYKRPVYVFREKGVDVPIMVNYTTVYLTYDPMSQESLKEAMQRVAAIGSRLKSSADFKNTILIILVIFFLSKLFAGETDRS